METIIVIPTFNEAENLAALLESIFALGLDVGILVVDDASPDGTGEIADRLAQEDSRVMVLHRKGKLGLGTAYTRGFTQALAETDAQLIAQMDADFSHHPKYIPRLIQMARQGALAIGSRYVPGGGVKNWKLSRRLVSRFGSLYARAILGVPVSDLTGGFKCWPRAVLEAISLDRVRSNGYGFQCEMTFLAHRAGFSIRETPIIFEDRREGESKMTAGIALEGAWIVLKQRFFLGLPPK